MEFRIIGDLVMQGKSKQNRQFVKTGEAAEILGVTPATIRAAVRRGDLPGVKLGSQFLVVRSSIEKLTASSDTESSEAG